MRIIKQPEEITAIRKAIKITEDAIKETVRPSKLPKYNFEYEIEASVTKGMRFRGARGHAFDPIVAAGINACTLHNVSNESELNKRDLVVIDVGAEYENYAADITRTYSLSTKPSKRQKDVYAAVKDTQEYAISLLMPGKLLKEYEEQIESYMGEKLRSLGLIKSINRENVRRYFPHATSHFLGLNVHDIGEYDKPLQPGAVITAEPGIYIKEEAIGVRIEDDVLITAKGNQVLSTRLPKNL
jgi:Xaa-Pro aminopeptidase